MNTPQSAEAESKFSDNAITYTNTASRVTFTFGHTYGVLVSANGKLNYLSESQAEDFALALEEAGYRVVA